MKLANLLFRPGSADLPTSRLLLLRAATGAFLVYESHDNVFSAAHIDEFARLHTQFGLAYPEYWRSCRATPSSQRESPFSSAFSRTGSASSPR